MKKAVAILHVLMIFLSLTACESSKIKEAKSIVDELVVYTVEKLDAEIELESATSDQKIALLHYEIELKESLIEYCMNDLDEIYAELSVAGQREVQEYIDNAYRDAVEQYNNSK